MRHSNAFSLIETLAAVVIASITALAILQIQSSTSQTSARVINTYNDSLIMGLISEYVTNNIDTIRTDETLMGRYNIDNSIIMESLEPYTYDVIHHDVESIDPLMMSDSDSTLGTHFTLSLQKFTLVKGKNQKSFFRITSGAL
jgi:type II secretory pathway pseudopilin PulG